MNYRTFNDKIINTTIGFITAKKKFLIPFSRSNTNIEIFASD